MKSNFCQAEAKWAALVKNCGVSFYNLCVLAEGKMTANRRAFRMQESSGKLSTGFSWCCPLFSV